MNSFSYIKDQSDYGFLNDMEPLCSLLDIGQNQRKKVFKKVKSCQSKGYL